MQERALCERLITYDTSTMEGIQTAAGFVKGWFEAREIDVKDGVHNGVPVLAATVGADEGPVVILHGHVDVVPGRPEQFVPAHRGRPPVRARRLRHEGRPGRDDAGRAATWPSRTACACTSSAWPTRRATRRTQRGSDYLVEKGYTGDFAITGEPTDLHIGVQAKGVLALRIEVRGKAAHGSTPWEGDNAVLKAVDVFRAIEALPFAAESSDLFPRPSISLGRIIGGDALNKVPDRCVIDVDIRYLPGQEAKAVLAQIEAITDTDVSIIFHREPAVVSRRNPYVRMLAESVEEGSSVDRISVGRDGASDAVSFLEAGVPAVEFGPSGAGHHGPEEWVSIESLAKLPQGARRLRGAGRRLRAPRGEAACRLTTSPSARAARSGSAT